MKKIGFSDVEITDGFWKAKQDMIKDTTAEAVYRRFCETHRFDALRCSWKEGDPAEQKPHIFWDSDVAKWMEGAAYLLKQEDNAEWKAILEEAIANILRNSDENGYFNSHFLVTEQEERFRHREQHELYCAGHLMEAAVAYFDATGDDAFLKAMSKFADYIERVFKIEGSAGFVTPGHPEIELALVRMYEVTKEKRYLDLAKFFIDEHGKHPEEMEDYYDFANSLYNQDEMPVRDRKTADGHSVRALYLYCAMVDVAVYTKDEALLAACERLFENMVNKRMYITGGLGSTHLGEAFTVDYDLPNRTAYAETCASIAMALFAGRMQAVEPNAKYADAVEREIYNGILSGISMKGDAFFYENPLEIDPAFNDVNVSTTMKSRYPITQRKTVFDCSCCPPNLVRFIPSIAGWMYSYREDTLFVHQYMNSKMSCDGMSVTQTTAYPADGVIHITCSADKKYIALRIPGWCEHFQLNAEYEMRNGYAFVELNGETNLTLKLEMKVTAVRANRRVHENAGRIAIMRGPVVYCAEGIDNGEDLRSFMIDPGGTFELSDSDFLLPALKTIAYREQDTDRLYVPVGDGYESVPLTLIPYYAFANRETSEMLVWFLQKHQF